ncbi:MAG: zinc ABC transporter substrate-binding protein [Methanolinea sp.]|nr:zinc ABC transporter substrate-binding protein [Methanolinea sp.]
MIPGGPVHDVAHPRPPARAARTLLSSLLALLVLASVAGCLDGPAHGRGPPHARTAVVTVPPQEEVVREIAGDGWEIVAMVPPGAEPHTYEPPVSTVGRASTADAYFRLGPGLLPLEDVLVARLVAQNPRMAVVNMSDGIALLRGGDGGGAGGVDPHVWLSPANLRVMATNVAAALSAMDPDRAGEYAARRDAYLRKVDSCEEAIERNLMGLEGRSFLVFHPAFGYFARDFGLSQVAVEAGGHEPGPAEISRIVTFARENGITVVFAAPQFSTRESEVIAREINGTVALVDPLSPDVTGNLVRISGAIAEGMRSR